MSYIIVFEGALKEGVSHQQTVELLAKLAKLDVDRAEKHFFTGKPVTLKKVDSKAAAETFQKKLYGYGLLVSIQAQALPKASASSVVKTDSSHSTPIRKKRWSLWVGGAALVCVLALVCAFIWLNQLFKVSIPERVIQAENVFFAQNVALLSYVNMAKISEIDAMFGGGSQSSLPMVDEELQHAFSLAGLSPRDHLSHFLYAITLNDQNEAQHHWVFMGDFTKAAVESVFKKHYETRVSDSGELLFTKQNRDNCKYSPERALVIEDGIALIGSPGLAQPLLSKMKSSPVEPSAPESWVSFRDNRFMSLGVFLPKDAIGTLTGFTRMMVSGVLKDDTALNSVYAGVRGKALPPGAYADVVLNTNNASWAEEAHQAISAWQSDMINDAETHALVKGFTSNLSVVSNDQALSGEIYLSKAMLDEVKTTVREGIGSLFSFGGSSMSGEITEDQIDENKKPFLASVSADAIPDIQAEHSEVFAWQEGPVGLGIKTIRLDADNLIEIELLATSKNIPNAAEEGFASNGVLNIEGVYDSSGANVMAEQTCGEDINSDPAAFKPSFFGKLEAAKIIQLKPDVDIQTLDHIKGTVTTTINTKTRTQLLAVPLKNHKLDIEGLDFTIKSAENQTLSLSYVGDLDKIAGVRGLNKDKQYLQSGGSMSSGGDGRKSRKTKSQSFQGQLGFVELIYVEQQATKSSDFRLSQLAPSRSPSGFGQPWQAPQALGPSDWQSFISNTQPIPVEEQTNSWRGEPIFKRRYGSAQLSLFKADSFVMMDELKVRMPCEVTAAFQEGLADLGVVEIVLQELILNDGTAMPLEYVTQAGLSRSTVYVKAEGEQNATSKPVLSAQCDIDLKVPVAEDTPRETKPVSVSGELRMRAPKLTRIHKSPLVMLGQTIELDDASLKVLEISHNAYTFALQGDHRKISDVVFLNAKDEKLGFGFKVRDRTVFDKFVETPDKIGVYSISSGQPTQIIVIEALDQFAETYPMQIGLNAQ